ncbi:hypothetical protein pb186bvf_018106 [Paramecium bursaria]
MVCAIIYLILLKPNKKLSGGNQLPGEDFQNKHSILKQKYKLFYAQTTANLPYRNYPLNRKLVLLNQIKLLQNNVQDKQVTFDKHNLIFIIIFFQVMEVLNLLIVIGKRLVQPSKSNGFLVNIRNQQKQSSVNKNISNNTPPYRQKNPRSFLNNEVKQKPSVRVVFEVYLQEKIALKEGDFDKNNTILRMDLVCIYMEESSKLTTLKSKDQYQQIPNFSSHYAQQNV